MDMFVPHGNHTEQNGLPCKSCITDCVKSVDVRLRWRCSETIILWCQLFSWLSHDVVHFPATLGMLEFSLLYDEEKHELHCNIIKAKVFSSLEQAVLMQSISALEKIFLKDHIELLTMHLFHLWWRVSSPWTPMAWPILMWNCTCFQEPVR